MKITFLFLSMISCFSSFETFSQNVESVILTGNRSVRFLEINSYRLDNHILIKALDSTSNTEFFILSDRGNNVKCASNEIWSEIKLDRFYALDLEIYPLFPLTLDTDSLRILFDSRPLEVNMNGVSFSKENLPYQCLKVIRDRICIIQTD